MSAATACGREDGDYLEISNKWASVSITLLADGSTRVSPSGLRVLDRVYFVEGDTKDGDSYKRTMEQAMAYALASLAEYQKGRAE